MAQPARRLLWMACAAALDATAIEAADAIYVLRQGRQTVVRRADLGAGDLDHADGDGQIKAPMHGKVLALLVSERRTGGKGSALGHYRGDEDGARFDRAARLAALPASRLRPEARLRKARS